MRINASNLNTVIPQAKKTHKVTVFLGGDCYDNEWREALEKEFPAILFLDPYTEDWQPEKNIYSELAGMTVSDHVVFYKGGIGSKREKEFLKSTGGSYKEFDDLDKLRKYVGSLPKPTRKASDLLREASQQLLLGAAVSAEPLDRFFTVGPTGEATMSETGPGLPCKLIMFPNLRQAHSWDCGATIVESMLQFYGFDVRADEALKALKTDKNGTDIGEIKEFLKKKGLKVWAGTATIDDVKASIDKGLPCILCVQAYPDKKKENWEEGWSNGHYVAAIGYTSEHIILSDPSSVQDAYMSYTDLNKRWHDQGDDKTKLDHFMIVPYGRPQEFNWNKILPLES